MSSSGMGAGCQSPSFFSNTTPVSSCTCRTKGHEIIRDGQPAAVWLGRLAEEGSHSASLSRVKVGVCVCGGGGGDIRICWITVLEDSAPAFASSAKMWQWGNSVTAYCVMSPWFLSYCAGDEREKNGEQRIQHMMKGSPCWWGICEALFKKAGWQRMRRRRRKNGWAPREKYIRPIVQLRGGSTQQTGWGWGGWRTYSLTPAIKYLTVAIYTVTQSVQGLII